MLLFFSPFFFPVYHPFETTCTQRLLTPAGRPSTTRMQCRITVITFLMPVSVMLNTLFYARAQFSFWYMRNFAGAGIEAHDERVGQVVEAIRKWRDGGMKTKLTTSRPGWATMSLRVPKYKVRVFRVYKPPTPPVPRRYLVNPREDRP